MIDGTPIDESLYSLNDIVEKPAPEDAPSNVGTIGRYIFTPEIFDCIKKTGKGFGGEIQLTDAIKLLNQNQQVYAYRFTGNRYDTGDKLGYVKAIIDFALKNEKMKNQISEYLIEIFVHTK